MHIELTDEERASIETALVRERRVRHWRRYQAIRLLAEGHTPRMVAATLGVSVASIYNWAEAWRERKQDGMKEGARPGRTRQLDAAAEGMLATWLGGSPRAYAHAADLWTVPLLRAQLAGAGYRASEHTLRRALHRLGWRWKDGGYVLVARPGVARPGVARKTSPASASPTVPPVIAPEIPVPTMGFDLVSG